MLTADCVKQQARGLGSDLVGIASADVLNLYPPDPAHPQVPERIAASVRSAVVVAKRIPLGVFLSRDKSCAQHLDQLVLRELDEVAYRLARWLDGEGAPSFPVITNETDPHLKRGSYGYLSTRHVAIEAGLGTLGLDLNLLTPEYGPRVYVAVVLTDAALAPDEKMTQQVCIGEPCGRCVLACPPDAVLQFGLDKRSCRTYAQPFGMNRLRSVARAVTDADTREAKQEALAAADGSLFSVWQSMLRCVGGFGSCPRCLAVCPVGADYVYLRRDQKAIPERTEAKDERVDAMTEARHAEHDIPGLSPYNLRWIGEAGYHGPLPTTGVQGLPASVRAPARTPG